MSAIQGNASLMILPKVWGCAEVRVFEAGPGFKPLVLVGGGRGAEASRFHREGGSGPQRLKPHLVGPVDGTAEAVPLSEARSAGFGRLHLVRASAAFVEDPTMAADGPIALRRQEVLAAGGVGYEFYRKYTEAMLRRYMTMSFENGRVPSMLGRELFRGKASTFTINSFEDVSNFVHDMGRCLQLLDAGQRHLVRRIALEEYTMEETAAMLGMSLRTVVRRYREAIDRLTRVLLERGMLKALEAGGEEARVL